MDFYNKIYYSVEDSVESVWGLARSPVEDSVEDSVYFSVMGSVVDSVDFSIDNFVWYHLDTYDFKN